MIRPRAVLTFTLALILLIAASLITPSHCAKGDAASRVTSKVELSWSESGKESVDASSTRTITYPNAIETSSSTVYDSSKQLNIRVIFEKGASKPKAAFVLIASSSSTDKKTLVAEESKDALIPLKADAKDDALSIRLSLSSSELVERLAGPGAYDISIVYGDDEYERGVEWKVAKNIQLQLPSPTRAEYEASFASRPLIAHTFRQSESRAIFIVPIVFALLVFGALGGLLYSLNANGFTRIALPSNPTELMYAGIFQCSIVAILFSYTLYWLSLNIFQAIALSTVCGAVAVFSGTTALQLRHQRKSRAQVKEE